MKNAIQHAADATVSHGDALAYSAEGNIEDAAYSARECRERVQRCHEAAAREGTAEARETALRAAGLLTTLPAPATPEAWGQAYAAAEKALSEPAPALAYRSAADRIAGFAVADGVEIEVAGEDERRAVEAYRRAWGDRYNWVP